MGIQVAYRMDQRRHPRRKPRNSRNSLVRHENRVISTVHNGSWSVKGDAPMESSTEVVAPEWQAQDAERARLVRLCTRIVGDPIAAEDLAQEALLLAWQRGHQLHDPERRDAWLKAIARNLCRRWLRDRPQSMLQTTNCIDDQPDLADELDPADEFDLEIELERNDLARLLDRAMALLPPETRQVLVAQFLEELPQAETARRLGLTQGTVAMRVQRGKLALRHILTSAFPEELADYRPFAATSADQWQTTRIWCPKCGERRVESIFSRKLGLFRLRCPHCGSQNNTFNAKLLAAATGYRSAMSALLDWVDWFYKHSLVHRTVPCHGCENELTIYKSVTPRAGISSYDRFLSYRCRRCTAMTLNAQFINILALPETRRFWRHHPRIRSVDEREVEAAGCPAIVAGFESVSGSSRLDIIYARDTFDLIEIHGHGIRP
jgi:RNA polymerase sigma factor (sigma-70 family)